MMEENNDIFLAGGDALVYLAEPTHKKYSATFVCVHPFSTYVSYDQFFNSLPLYASLHILDDSPQPQFLHLRTYLMDGLFLNQKTNKNIRISYSLKYKHPNKILFTKNKWQCRINKKFQGNSINQKPNSAMPIMLCTGATFVKKNSCLVSRIVSFGTVGLELLTFRSLEPYWFKDILTLTALLKYPFSPL